MKGAGSLLNYPLYFYMARIPYYFDIQLPKPTYPYLLQVSPRPCVNPTRIYAHTIKINLGGVIIKCVRINYIFSLFGYRPTGIHYIRSGKYVPPAFCYYSSRRGTDCLWLVSQGLYVVQALNTLLQYNSTARWDAYPMVTELLFTKSDVATRRVQRRLDNISGRNDISDLLQSHNLEDVTQILDDYKYTAYS